MKKVYVVMLQGYPIHVSDKKQAAHEWAIDHNDLNKINNPEDYVIETFISLDEFKTWRVLNEMEEEVSLND